MEAFAADHANTERELDVALQMLSEGRNIMFLSYFRELAKNTGGGEQEEKVRKRRAEPSKRGLFYKTFTTPEEFKDEFAH